jgi:hypothetical protein
MSAPGTLARALLAAAAAILVGGSHMHAAAFGKVTAAVAAAPQLPRFYGQALEGLWLADFLTLA